MSPIIVQQLAYATPQLLVYLVGIVLALIFIRKYPGPALLTLAGVIIFLATTFGLAVTQGLLMRFRIESGWSNADYNRMMAVTSVAGSLMRALGLALLLAAVFVGRKSKTST